MNGPETPEKGRPPEGEEAMHVYRAAGIRERTGRVPWWLIGVCVGLFLWGGYYIVRYWTPGG